MSAIAKQARVTGFVEPAENDGWMIDTSVPAYHYDGSFGSVLRTGRGALEPGEPVTRLIRKTPLDDGRVGKTLVMSDTPDEMRDLLPILYSGKGRVVVNGLGLGCVVKGLLTRPEVEHIDVVEISGDLIDLVGHYYESERVTIHQGDAFDFKWPRGTRWNCAWHDVWDTLDVDNLSNEEYAEPGTYAALHRRYGRRVDWQGSWGWDFLQAQRSRSGW